MMVLFSRHQQVMKTVPNIHILVKLLLASHLLRCHWAIYPRDRIRFRGDIKKRETNLGDVFHCYQCNSLLECLNCDKVPLYSTSNTPSNAFFHHFQSFIGILSSHFSFSSSFPFEIFLLGSEIRVGVEDGHILHRLWQTTAVEG